jgi:hypothetical protein
MVKPDTDEQHSERSKPISSDRLYPRMGGRRREESLFSVSLCRELAGGRPDLYIVGKDWVCYT